MVVYKMDRFDELYERITADPPPNTTITAPKPMEDRFYSNSGFTSPSLYNNNKMVLSNIGFSTINSYNEVRISSSNDVKIGLIGIYRRAYPRTTTNDYGYLEETRIVTKIGLYSSKIVLELSPVIYIEYTDDGSIAHCGANKVELILYRNTIPPLWIQLKDGHYIRGCSFDAHPHPTGRTLVIDGRYVEKGGFKTTMSANLIVPNRFIELFKEALNTDPIIWW